MLPKISGEVHSKKMPVSKDTIKFRPYTSGEEKLIWMARQSEDADDILKTLKEIIQNCSYDELDIDKMSLIDFQYLCIQIRMKSFGDVIENTYQCDNVVDDKVCGEPFTVAVKENELKLNHELEDDQEKRKIMINDKVGLILKYPTFAITQLEETDNPYDEKFLQEYIDCIFDEEQVYNLKECTKEELKEFIDSIPRAKMEKIQEWVLNVPRYSVTKKHKCKKCGADHVVEVDDLSNFF